MVAPYPDRRQSTSDGAASPRGGSAQHRRTYQACIPCRQRKVRCDLGSVDDPHDPPCVRCRRESKECYFSATRRKRRPAEVADEVETDDAPYDVRNGRKRVRVREEVQPVITGGSRASQHHPLTPGGSAGQYQPLRRPEEGSASDSRQASFDEDDHYPEGYSPNVDDSGMTPAETGVDDQHLTAEKLLHTEVYSGHDALNLLFEAAGRSGDIAHPRDAQTKMKSASVATMEPPMNGGIPRDVVNAPYAHIPTSKRHPTAIPIDPALTGGKPLIAMSTTADQGPGDGALRAWSNCRFVRAGWFTAREAIAYIAYFYEYMSPLTPISPPSFRDPVTHAVLLAEDPILAVTLLTISSRYMRLSGPGGLSRSYAIHEKLWNYLRGMIERIIWGQEQFGASGGGVADRRPDAIQTSSTAPWRGLRKGSLRTLGTVESLMLLTEWHPRALHFPPGDDGDELVVNNSPEVESLQQMGRGVGGVPPTQRGIGGKRIESWLEPAWRSDRMCWMLLGNALALSFELGVFDGGDGGEVSNPASYRPEYSSPAYRVRATRLRNLLLVYLTQLSGRLDWPNPCDGSILANLKLPTDSPAPKHVQGASDDIDDVIQRSWIEVTTLMRTGNELLFSTREHTRDLIRSGRYTSLLEHFQPRLHKCRQDIDQLNIPIYMRHILNIEYEYVRVYINSLALQAVVERCANPGGGNESAEDERIRGYTGNVPFSTLAGLYGGDQGYIKEVVDASRSLLQTVVDGLLPGGYLQHAPVRTYFRIVSGAMFLLKTFALGAKEDDVAISLGLLDSAVQALRTCVVDDVHLGIRFADLLDVLTKRIRSRFVRMAGGGGGGGQQHQQQQRGDSRSPAPNGFNGNNNRGTTRQGWPISSSTSSSATLPASASLGPPPAGGGNIYSTSVPVAYLTNNNNNNNPSTTTMNMSGGGGGFDNNRRSMTPNPLFGISTESIHPEDNSISIMPPPSLFPYGPGPASSASVDGGDNNTGGGATFYGTINNNPGGIRGGGGPGGIHSNDPNNNSGNLIQGGNNPPTNEGNISMMSMTTNSMNEDWLALPLDPLLNMNSQGGQAPGVTQTSFMGPDVGGWDLLEVLLDEMDYDGVEYDYNRGGGGGDGSGSGSKNVGMMGMGVGMGAHSSATSAVGIGGGGGAGGGERTGGAGGGRSGTGMGMGLGTRRNQSVASMLAPPLP